MLDALAARRPGRYRYETESAHGSGHTTVRHLLLVRADGSAQYVRSEHEYSISRGSSDRLDPGQRCTLKPASYFEACGEAALGPFRTFEQPAWGCVFGDGSASTPSHLLWFESCVEESPSTCDPGGYGSSADAAADAG